MNLYTFVAGLALAIGIGVFGYIQSKKASTQEGIKSRKITTAVAVFVVIVLFTVIAVITKPMKLAPADDNHGKAYVTVDSGKQL